jgi:kynurenine formamidase
MADAPSMAELLGDDTPKNWGKWGPDDQIGSLNYLDAAQVLRGVASVKDGQVFTLQCPMGLPHGDPVFPGREGIQREMVWDQDAFAPGGVGPQFPGGLRASDDKATMFLQGSSQYDALGHAWYDDRIWNDVDAETTNGGGMSWASIMPIAERGIVGHGVLIDMARHRNKEWLEKGETFTHHDLEEAAAAQGTTIENRDVVVIRTGWLKYFYAVPKEEFYEGFVEPGLTYSRELVEWFQDKEIPNLVTDTIANEVTHDPKSGVTLPLHAALLRNLGISLAEIIWLDDLADACAADDRWDFLYTAAPLKIHEATGAPVNPVVIR